MSKAAFVVERPNPTALRAVNYSPLTDRMLRHGQGQDARALKSLASRFATSYGNVFTRIDCASAAGVQLLSQVDLFAAEPDGRVIRRDSMPFALQHEVHRGDILLAGAGQVGEATLFGRGIIADARLAGGFVDGHAVQIGFDEPLGDLGCYVYAYLTSSVGLILVRSTAYGTSVPGIRIDLLGQLPVPMPDTQLMGRIAVLIRQAVADRERFAQEILAARALIEQLPEMKAAHAACAVRRPRAGAHEPALSTLNAWNYVSTGAALPLLRRTWKARLGDVVPADGIFNGLRFARVGCEPPYGVQLLTQRDVFLTRPVPQRVAHPGFDDRWLFAPEGSILIGGAGTLGEGEIFGRAVFVSREISKYAVTQDMLRIIPSRDYAAVVYAFLSTLVGRRLLRSTGAGTKLLRMRPDLIRALPIPDVTASLARGIANHLITAMQARDAASLAEAEAIRLVDTEVIPAWLS